MFIKLFLIVTFIPLQSCSKTLIGEKLEKSFDVIENSKLEESNTKFKLQNKSNEIKKIKLSENDNENEQLKIKTKKFVANKERPRQDSSKSIKKVIFNPQPYRIILKLSGANPSAPAETVTNALRKAGVEFEVEKIERFEEKSLLKNASLKRK